MSRISLLEFNNGGRFRHSYITLMVNRFGLCRILSERFTRKGVGDGGGCSVGRIVGRTRGLLLSGRGFVSVVSRLAGGIDIFCRRVGGSIRGISPCH